MWHYTMSLLRVKLGPGVGMTASLTGNVVGGGAGVSGARRTSAKRTSKILTTESGI